MGFKSWIKQGIGLAGKHLMNAANAYTGGLAGKIFNKGLEHVDKQSGVIGSGLKWIGNKILSDENRQKLSNIADKVLDYIPDGKVKNTLSKINDAAQGRDVNSIKYAEPKSQQKQSKKAKPNRLKSS